MTASEPQLRHLLDLCHRAERTGLRMTSGFCSPAEQDDFIRCPESAKFIYSFQGGFPGAERQILVAGESEEPLPIAALAVEPLSEKYAEELSHRDYLGAILGLGIDRSLTGDILVRGKHAWVFCLESIADFLCQSLTQVRKTSVRAERTSLDHPDLAPQRESVSLNVASERLDALVAAFADLSRAQASNLFAAGKVFVNSRPALDRSAQLHEGDILSVRGVGKAEYRGISRETRKGRLVVQLEKYR